MVLSGSWVIPGHEKTSYNGKLHYSKEEKGLVLELEIPEEPESYFTNGLMIHFEKSRYKAIQGTLFNGGHLLLYDCVIGPKNTRLFQYTTVIIYATYGFWGLEQEEPLVFKAAHFNFGEIVEWSGLCKFDDNLDSKKPGYTWEHKDSVSFALNGNATVKFSPVMGGWSSDNVFATRSEIRQSIDIKLEYQEDVDWETVINDAQVVRYLIGLGINRLPNIEGIKYKHNSMASAVPGGGDRIYYPAYEVLLGTGKDPVAKASQKNERFHYWYSLPQVQNVNGLEKWISSYQKLKPVLDLYFSVGGALSADAAFLSLMQALETFHARFFTDKLSEYKNMIAPYQGSTTWWPLLFSSDQQNHKGIILKSRLASLMFADGQVPFYSGTYSHDAYIQKLVDTRNYFTHYDESKEQLTFSQEELPFVNQELEYLLDYHLLVLLGFDKGDVRKEVVGRMNELQVNYQLWIR
jgi:hypothetical protein